MDDKPVVTTINFNKLCLNAYIFLLYQFLPSKSRCQPTKARELEEGLTKGEVQKNAEEPQKVIMITFGPVLASRFVRLRALPINRFSQRWISIGKYNISHRWLVVSFLPRLVFAGWSVSILFAGLYLLKKSVDTEGFSYNQVPGEGKTKNFCFIKKKGGVIKCFFFNKKKGLKLQKKKGGDVNKETWSMFDHNNRLVHKEDFLGKYTLIYFGFTFCPDVCPVEMKKMAELADILEERGMLSQVMPVFVSVDYRRDSPKVVQKYLEDYSTKILGLCGTREQIEHFAKVMKTYFSRPPELEEDYILEHSAYMYFTDKNGDFKHLTNSEDGPKVLADKIALWIAEDSGTVSANVEKVKQLFR
ncbi:hypothetical protein RFI_35480 [Reticulomyxa filosa]|uniref:Thioredoxin domain-containing protein n=1 Tax=Reticulomyxa filosa TaxID=46433 RepID=X6LK41_RETFI|nr:hypothetical protein RFI_35480 [Reticulomyxa filosa]|eukprot:ETO01959.1 hypothetical protein RFI_35480 [Reticulomyxa filosa]